jgi:hypothetical protein
MSDYNPSKQESFNNWSRHSFTQHETALVNLQNWFFALCRCSNIKPEAMAKAIMELPAQHSFGKNLQMRLKEETDKAMKKEKEKLSEEAKKAEEIAKQFKIDS